MTQVAKVAAFMTTDNKIFLDRDEAQAHQDELDIKSKLELFLKEKNMPFCYMNGTQEEEFIDGMVKHREEILKILQNV